MISDQSGNNGLDFLSGYNAFKSANKVLSSLHDTMFSYQVRMALLP